MAETLVAWPTLIAVERLALERGVDLALHEAALQVERLARPAGDPRHFSSTVDNHAEVFPEPRRATLAHLWDSVSAAVRSYLAGGFGIEAAHPLSWTLNIFVARQGDRVPIHCHPQRDLFAVYYPCIDALAADSGGPNGGELRLVDGRHWGRKWINRNTAFFDSAYLTLKPEPGMLVIAPSYVLHETNAFTGPGRRVSYGFFINVVMTKEFT